MSKAVDFSELSETDNVIYIPEYVDNTSRIKLFDPDDIFTNARFMDEFEKQSQCVTHGLFFYPNGIHGVGHSRRVLFLCLLLSFLNNLNDTDKQILIEASKFHDVGRVNDEDCEIHGYLSYRKMIGAYSKYISQNSNAETLRYVIENHCVADDEAIKRINKYNIKNVSGAIRLLKLFKDADALDRVRTNDLDMDYLRFPCSRQLLGIARKLLCSIPGL